MTDITGYSRAQIRLHWLTAGLVLLQFLFHEGISDAFEEGTEGGALTLTGPAIGHMAGGMLILFLVLWRLALRRDRGAPKPPHGEPVWARLLAPVAHWGLYALLVALPITGAGAWALASEPMGELHEALRGLLLLLILAHIGAVVVHQLLWKTGLVSRMMRPGR